MTPLNFRRQKSHLALMEAVGFDQCMPKENLAVRLKLPPVIETSWQISLISDFLSSLNFSRRNRPFQTNNDISSSSRISFEKLTIFVKFKHNLLSSADVSTHDPNKRCVQTTELIKTQ